VTRAVLLLLLAGAPAFAEDWLLPRGDLQNTGVVGNRGPRRAPEAAWKREEADLVTSGLALCAGRLFFGVGETTFVSRSARDGARLGEKSVKQAVVAWPAVQGDLVLFGGQDHVLYRVRMATLEEPASPEANGPVVAWPAVTETHYLCGSLDGRFYAVDVKSGAVLWSAATGPVRHAAAVARNLVLVVNETGVLHAFDLRSGKLAWKVEAGAAPAAPPMVAKDGALLPVTDAVLRYDPRTGKPLSRIEAKGLRGTPAVDGRTLLFGTEQGELVAVGVREGSETRRAKIADAPVGGALVVAGKTLYGSAGATLFAADAATLEPLWRVAGEEPFGSPIVADGSLYVAAGKVLYCYR
jgi:hypothetical protein